MATHRLGLVMHGVTGRMGLNQHLKRSILAIRDAGGVALQNGDRVVPEPLLLGRSDRKLREIARGTGLDAYTTDYDAAIQSAEHTLFFDAGATLMRPELIGKAIAAGKHVYCEKPVAGSLAAAVEVCEQARELDQPWQEQLVHDDASGTTRRLHSTVDASRCAALPAPAPAANERTVSNIPSNAGGRTCTVANLQPSVGHAARWGDGLFTGPREVLMPLRPCLPGFALRCSSSRRRPRASNLDPDRAVAGARSGAPRHLKTKLLRETKPAGKTAGPRKHPLAVEPRMCAAPAAPAGVIRFATRSEQAAEGL